MDPPQRVLAVALGISVLFHALVLSIHFQFPNVMRKLTAAQPLEVVLVNSKSRNRPVKPDVLAQANLDGGGNTDDNRRAKTPLPVTPSVEVGDDLQRATRRVQELEAQQRQLLAQMEQAKTQSAPSAMAPTPRNPQVSGVELRSSALALMKLEAEISRNVDEYNKRPRKLNVGARAAETSVALYLDEWRRKIERIGTQNYPDEARGKFYGSLQLTVSLDLEGAVVAVQLDRSSGVKVIDEAAVQIVRAGSPYARLPDKVRKDYQILEITRTWTFARGDRVFTD
jgi:protein TonB